MQPLTAVYHDLLEPIEAHKTSRDRASVNQNAVTIPMMVTGAGDGSRDCNCVLSNKAIMNFQ